MLEPIREAALRRLRADDSLNKSALVRHAEFYADLAESAANGLHGDRQWSVWTNSKMNSATSARSWRLPALSHSWILRSGCLGADKVLGHAGSGVGNPRLDEMGARPTARRSSYSYPRASRAGSIAATDWAYERRRPRSPAALPPLRARRPRANCPLRGQLGRLLLRARRHGLAGRTHPARPEPAARIGDPWAEAYVWAELGIATESPDVAYVRLQRALDLYGSLGDRLWSSHIKSNLAWYAIIDGDYAYARRLCEEGAGEGRGRGRASKCSSNRTLVWQICSRIVVQMRGGTSAWRWHWRGPSGGGSQRRKPSRV